MARGDYMGADEVKSLIGGYRATSVAGAPFVDIVGGAPFVDIVGQWGRHAQWERDRQWGQPAWQQQQPAWQQPQGGGFAGRRIRAEEWRRLHPGYRWEERERRRLEWERNNPGLFWDEVERAWEAQNPGQVFMGASWSLGAAVAPAAAPLPPRNELIERAAPTLAGRRLLPMSSGGTNIAYQTSAQITSRPQGIAYRPERITIDSSVGIDSTTPTPVPTVYDASSWVLNDVKVGNISQYMQSGDIPGGMFAPNAVDSFVDFMTVQTAQDFVMIVTFTGFAGTGEGTPAAPFSCGVTGTAAV